MKPGCVFPCSLWDLNNSLTETFSLMTSVWLQLLSCLFNTLGGARRGAWRVGQVTEAPAAQTSDICSLNLNMNILNGVKTKRCWDKYWQSDWVDLTKADVCWTLAVYTPVCLRCVCVYLLMEAEDLLMDTQIFKSEISLRISPRPHHHFQL